MAGLNAGPVKLPPDFDLQGQNAATEWKFWRTSFEDYLTATGQHEAADRVKLSILRNIMGTESARIMSTFKIPEEQTNNYEYVMNFITKYVNPRVNESFERYNFLKRIQKEGETIQKEGETFEHFLTECKHLVKSCNYNEIDPQESQEDKALRDKIVMGIRDPVTREALLRVDKLTLEKAIQHCRTTEQSKTQNQQIQTQNQQIQQNGGNECNVNSIKEKKKHREVKEENDSDSSSELKKLRRRIIGNVKLVRNVCKCNKLSCSHKEGTWEEVIETWEEVIEIEGKKVKTKLDTGADVYEDFVIVEKASQVLLGGQACLHLNLVKRINTVNKSEPNNEKEIFIQQNLDIFSGSGVFSDPSDLNKYVVRKPRLNLNIEEVCSKLRGKNLFSVFDLSEGYHHLKLDECSSWKCCFSTPFGIYRYTVLPYGLSDSQDLFEEEVEKRFGNIDNVIICHDDMIISGATKQNKNMIPL
ncbi:hypothetical protein QE152_g27804 [Popillia japonica]|uniref:Reverse transcriptase domain-containing protein n=1 Tax=Popillia japonica TaxID=7064 RepID=A0AAW1JJG4_POPJA